MTKHSRDHAVYLSEKEKTWDESFDHESSLSRKEAAVVLEVALKLVWFTRIIALSHKLAWLGQNQGRDRIN